MISKGNQGAAMINNFDAIKAQLKELAAVINSFKSEAVQLRLVELVFGTQNAERESDSTQHKRTKRRRGKGLKDHAVEAEKSGATRTRGSRHPGGKATLDRLYEEGFFKKAKTIKQLVEHCQNNLALKYKQSDFSGPLARLTRDGKLKRAKNADKQYEYSQA